MLTGYNTDFKFQGKIYHAQTEDGGASSPFITSLLYHQGEILASRKTSYADILKADCLEEVVRDLMMEQHKQIIRDLMQGKLDISNAPHEAMYKPSVEPQSVPTAEIPPAAEPALPPVHQEEIKEKSLDEIILDFLAQEQKERSKKQ